MWCCQLIQQHFIGQFYCSGAPKLFKAGTSFLNQMDKVVALEITAVQVIGPEIPFGLFNYFPGNFPKI